VLFVARHDPDWVNPVPHFEDSKLSLAKYHQVTVSKRGGREISEYSTPRAIIVVIYQRRAGGSSEAQNFLLSFNGSKGKCN
jgi:hypothetical protein